MPTDGAMPAAYVAPNYVSTGSATVTTATVTLTGQLAQEVDGNPGDLTQASAQFLLYGSGNLSMSTPDVIVPGTVDASGLVTGASLSLGADTYTVVVRVDPANTRYSGPASDPDMLTVYAPSPGAWIRRRSWVIDPSYRNMPVPVSSTNPKGHLRFDVRFQPGSTGPIGHASYSFLGADGYDYVMKSTSWVSGALVISSPQVAFFAGNCTITAVDPRTGRAVPGIGGGNFTFRVDFFDGGAGGSSDMYALSIHKPGGALYHQVGTRTNPIPLRGGNGTVQQK